MLFSFSLICALFCLFFAHGTCTIGCQTTNSTIAYFVGGIRQNGKEICGMAAFNLKYIYKVPGNSNVECKLCQQRFFL